MEPATPDHTRVGRLMGDFNEFMKSAQLHSRHSELRSGSNFAPIPCNMSAADDSLPLQAKSLKRKLEADKDEIFSKAKLAQMECKHASDEKAHKLARIQLESRNEKLHSENKLLNDKVGSLQFKLSEMTRQAIKAQDELNEMTSCEHSESKNLEESYLQLRKNKDECESTLQLKIAKFEEHVIAIENQNSQLILQNSSLQTKLEEKNVILQQKASRIEKLLENLNELKTAEKTVCAQEMEIKELEMRLSRADEAEKFATAMKDDFERLRKLEIEVVNLRKQNEHFRNNESNVLLMKEKMMAVEEKLLRNEKTLERAAIIELENRDLMAQLNEAKNREIRLSEGNDSKSVIDLRQKEAVYLSDIGELKTDLTLQKKTVESHKTKISELEKVIAVKTEVIGLKDIEIQNIKKRAILLQGECNSLRGIMQSYDTETATPHSEHLMKRIRNSESANEKLHSQLQNAQKMIQTSSQELTALRLGVKNLESKLSKMKENESHPRNEKDIASLQKKVEELESENETLSKKNQRLQLWAERNMRRGDFDPSASKVFHFRMNPADLAHKEAKKEVEELKEKCQKLQEKILKMESDQDVTTTCLDTTKLKELEEKVLIAELKNQRLKEVFSKRIQDFRQACYTLTGFRIDVMNDDHFKLTSRYAESEQDYLLFSADPAGGMQLLETDFSKTLDSLVKLHLHHQNSIPMFLSSLTVDLFAQQTAMTARFC